jgi:hypothetical protein
VDEDDEILSAEILFSDQEIIAEYQARCEEAARTHALTPTDLANAAKDLCRLLDRNANAAITHDE